MLRPSRELQGEAAVIAEGVERLALGQLGGAQMIFRLVEKAAGLVVLEQVDAQLDLALVIGGDDRRLSLEKLGPPGQPLEVAGAAVVARHDRLRAGHLGHDARQAFAADLRPFGEVLHSGGAAVEVDEIAREQIGLAVRHAEGIRLGKEGAPPLERALQPQCEQRFIERLVLARQHPQRDRALHRPERSGDEIAARIDDAHLGAAGQIRLALHVGPEDPGMARSRSRRALLPDGDGGRAHRGVGKSVMGAPRAHAVISLR